MAMIPERFPKNFQTGRLVESGAVFWMVILSVPAFGVRVVPIA
jgi:hypothetical protein